ncbi:nitroreductase family deazaflavin-dependent oxidoreductase [Rhodococcus rhodochrous]|uniref:nitroreductase/quinone reductase family protein n=1 Tax=Rhodococcus rhodochrous TaxID=1829 RepID=UPI001E448ECB|nr:nitroreductase/quinone reductase family protein [Rhodococcus rhodochrous]MCB8913390.1 nitroreductase family deazaflavin-dependent oxidoreductase [Rhodococcus rhodochrous]
MTALALSMLRLDRDSTAVDRTIEITTIGARTGLPRRHEIWFYRAFDTVYLTGRPGRRHWYANILANPALTVHPRTAGPTDIPAIGHSITDPVERRRVLTALIEDLRHSPNLTLDGPAPAIEEWVRLSPLVQLDFTPGGCGRTTQDHPESGAYG